VQLETRADALQFETLPGATSSVVLRVSTAGPKPRSAILRIFTNREWLAREPDLARHEAQALLAASAADLAAPKLIGVRDEPGKSRDGPCVFMSELEGAVWLEHSPSEGWLARLAETLAGIHRVALPPAFDWRYTSWTRPEQLVVPRWTSQPELWMRAIERYREGPLSSATVFVHRDFHPTNVLWRDGEVSGIVDWVNACLGPAGIDVAHCRLNLVAMYGIDAARTFLEDYRRARAGYVHDAYWDIEVLLGALPEPTYYAPWQEFGLNPIEPETLRARLEELLREASFGA
jgi:Ser/Thr protein kinase RdoA (MazF antagonist)